MDSSQLLGSCDPESIEGFDDFVLTRRECLLEFGQAASRDVRASHDFLRGFGEIVVAEPSWGSRQSLRIGRILGHAK